MDETQIIDDELRAWEADQAAGTESDAAQPDPTLTTPDE
jgi:hypothetical protein